MNVFVKPNEQKASWLAMFSLSEYISQNKFWLCRAQNYFESCMGRGQIYLHYATARNEHKNHSSI